jgi:hypothetical protein
MWWDVAGPTKRRFSLPFSLVSAFRTYVHEHVYIYKCLLKTDSGYKSLSPIFPFIRIMLRVLIPQDVALIIASPECQGHIDASNPLYTPNKKMTRKMMFSTQKQED